MAVVVEVVVVVVAGVVGVVKALIFKVIITFNLSKPKTHPVITNKFHDRLLHRVENVPMYTKMPK